MYIHDFFQNFLKTFLICFHGAFTSSVIAPDIPPGRCPLGAWGAEPSRSGAPDTRGKLAKEMEFYIPRKMDFEELTGCVPEIL